MGRVSRSLPVLLLLCASVFSVSVLVLPAAPAVALNNGLARTPPMGWNDWNAFGCNVNEQLVQQTADTIVNSGMKAAGYQYVNIDDCWMTGSRDAAGRLVPDPVKFPHGITGVANYVHGKGLKLGIYESAGTATCAGFPGSLGHEQTDANTFASWGVDYLKYDNCNNQNVDAVKRYTAMRDALKKTGRPIVYSICEWGKNKPWNWAPNVGNLWRTTGDISPNWTRMLSIINANSSHASVAGPGHWNDPDMLEIGNGSLSNAEQVTHFSLWAEMAAPLLIGTDLRKASQHTFDILSNRDVIAIDQDSLGKQGVIISSSGGLVVFTKQLANGDRAVALFNETGGTRTISTTAAKAGLKSASSYTLKDLWSKATRTTSGAISASVPSHGTVIFRVSAN